MMKYYGKAKTTLNLLNNRHCQKSQCEIIEKETDEFNYEGEKFTLYRTFTDNKLKITTIKDNKRGKIEINKFDDKSIEKAVDNCIKSAESSKEDKAFDIAPFIGKKEFAQGVIDPDLEKFFEKSKQFAEDISKKHPKIKIEQMVLQFSRINKLYLDSNDNEYNVIQGNYSIGLMYSGHEGEKSTSFNFSMVDFENLDKPFIELSNINEALSDVEKQLNTISFSGKFSGTIITEPSCLSDFIYSIVNNFAGQDSIINGTSIWRDKLNKKVADDKLTVSFSPKDKRIVNGDCYTADGFITENFDIIKDGVLNNYYIPLYVSNKTNFERSKNMSDNLIVKNGDIPLAQMIKNVKKGILIGRFSGGQPNINGDFSGVAKNSFFIENGQIKGALKEVMISGNLADLIKNIVTISKEVILDGSTVLPYIAFDNVVISGR